VLLVEDAREGRFRGVPALFALKAVAPGISGGERPEGSAPTFC
jgi:hypothetical protein